MKPYYEDSLATLYHGDCLKVMASLDAASVDAVVTDPPYDLTSIVKRFGKEGSAPAKPEGMGGAFTRLGKGFMGQTWDGTGVAFQPETWQAVLRVLKPGGYLVAFGGTRTSHRMVCAIEDAGFEIRDTIGYGHGGPGTGLYGWITGQGFPKSLNVSANSCFCQCSAVPYTHDNPSGTVRDMRGAAAPDASQPDAQVLLASMRERGPETAAGDSLCRVRPDMGDQQPDPSGAQQDLFGRMPVGAAPAAPAEVGTTQHDVRGVRSTLPSAAEPLGEGSGADVLPSVQREASGAEVGAALGEHEGPQADRPEVRRGQPGLEGGRDLLQDARELHGRPVRAGAGVGEADGAGGRLPDGAPSADGADVRSPTDADGSGAPPEPHAGGQRAEQPGIVADERRPSAGGGWPLCAGCGKPVVPKGLGTALKPAWEPIVLARKPLAAPTVAANVLQHGAGALNINGCRIGYGDERVQTTWPNRTTPNSPHPMGSDAVLREYDASKGRWPANVVLSHSPECVEVGTKRVKGTEHRKPNQTTTHRADTSGYSGAWNDLTFGAYHADPDGYETVPAWECAEDCAVAALDAQSGERKAAMSGPNPAGRHKNVYGAIEGLPVNSGRVGYPDTGGASRFYFCAKASPSERGDGNTHPTVKPLALCSWLVRLVTPSGGVVLDPFAGSGTTGIAAIREGFQAVLIEQNAEYLDITMRRLTAAQRIEPPRPLNAPRRDTPGRPACDKPGIAQLGFPAGLLVPDRETA